MRFPAEIENALVVVGVNPDDVESLQWTQEINKPPDLRYRLKSDQPETVMLNIVKLEVVPLAGQEPK